MATPSAISRPPGLAVLQSSAFVALARSGQLFSNQCDQFPIVPTTELPMWITLVALVITMTAGTGVVMWLGELITDRGIGNGMSILIFTQVSRRSRPRCGRSRSPRAGGPSP